MKLLVLILSAVAMAAVLAVGWVVLLGELPGGGEAGRELDRLLGAVPAPARRAETARLVGHRARALDASHGHWLGEQRLSLSPLWGLAAFRAAAAWHALPAAGIFLGTGIALGLARRERKRAEASYSSSTWSYVGKFFFAMSVAGYAFTAFSPVGFPVWMLYPLAACAAGGAALYLAHIPPKF